MDSLSVLGAKYGDIEKLMNEMAEILEILQEVSPEVESIANIFGVNTGGQSSEASITLANATHYYGLIAIDFQAYYGSLLAHIYKLYTLCGACYTYMYNSMMEILQADMQVAAMLKNNRESNYQQYQGRYSS